MKPPRSPGATSNVGPAAVRIRITRSKTAIKAQAGGMVGRSLAVNPPVRLYPQSTEKMSVAAG